MLFAWRGSLICRAPHDRRALPTLAPEIANARLAGVLRGLGARVRRPAKPSCHPGTSMAIRFWGLSLAPEGGSVQEKLEVSRNGGFPRHERTSRLDGHAHEGTEAVQHDGCANQLDRLFGLRRNQRTPDWEGSLLWPTHERSPDCKLQLLAGYAI